jgi:hypothetical protein
MRYDDKDNHDLCRAQDTRTSFSTSVEFFEAILLMLALQGEAGDCHGREYRRQVRERGNNLQYAKSQYRQSLIGDRHRIQLAFGDVSETLIGDPILERANLIWAARKHLPSGLFSDSSSYYSGFRPVRRRAAGKDN